MDVAGAIGEGVIARFGWGVQLTDFDLEVVVILYHNFLVAGLSLADPAKVKFKSRLANEDRSALGLDVDYVSTLRPSTTFLMVQLAACERGDVVLDSMCGVGTIPIGCAVFTHNSVFALGGELEALPVAKAMANARGRLVGVLQWDSTRLPLRPSTVDRVLIDMPFGVRCGNHRLNNKVRYVLMRCDAERLTDRVSLCGRRCTRRS